jgi:hypothetical protein
MATFTKNEVEIIQHRLEVPDAIIESLTDVPENEDSPWLEEEVGEAIESVEKRLNEDRWDGLSKVEIAVLVNCVEGSTWCACNECEQTGKFHGVAPLELLSLSRNDRQTALNDPGVKRRIRNVQKQMETLAEKVERLTGCPVSPALD